MTKEETTKKMFDIINKAINDIKLISISFLKLFKVKFDEKK